MRSTNAAFMNKADNFIGAFYYCGPEVLGYTNRLVEADGERWKADAEMLLTGMEEMHRREKDRHGWIRIRTLSGGDLAIFPCDVRALRAFKILSLLVGVPENRLRLQVPEHTYKGAVVKGASYSLNPLVAFPVLGGTVEATVVLSP